MLPRIAVVLSVLAVTAGTAAAQQQTDPRLAERPQPAGWSFTPRLTTSAAYDDNVLIQGKGDLLATDLNTGLSPAASLDYNGKRNYFSTSYFGAASLYRDFSTLNSYEQSVNASFRRQMTRHTTFFVQQNYSKVPTTEAQAISGVPFVRVGARMAFLRSGVEVQPSKRLSMNGSYTFQWIAFNDTPQFASSLIGGHANGGAAGARYQLTSRTTLTADYDVQRATIRSGGIFTVQNGWGGLDYQLTKNSHAYAAFGVAAFTQSDVHVSKQSPAWRLGYGRQFEAFALDVSYSRSFLPSYGNGGTLSSEDLTAGVHVPLGRRIYADSSFALRSTEALVQNQSLTSGWINAALGYAVQPWMHIEAFYDGTHQTTDLPGGRVDRNRIGIQVVTAQPVRIR